MRWGGGNSRTISTAAAAAAAFGQVGPAAEKPPAPPAMPAIRFGPHTISRMVAGWNPVNGHSHSTLNLHHAMLEYFTPDKTVEFLADCERNGITAWQFDYTEKSVEAIRRRHERARQ